MLGLSTLARRVSRSTRNARFNLTKSAAKRRVRAIVQRELPVPLDPVIPELTTRELESLETDAKSWFSFERTQSAAKLHEHIKHPRAIRLAAALMLDRNTQVRKQAVAALLRNKTHPAIPILLAQAMQDPSRSVRLTAVRGIRHGVNPRAVEALAWKGLRDPDDDVRTQTISSLSGAFVPLRIYPLLEHALKDPHYKTASIAASKLASAEGTRAFNLLLPALRHAHPQIAAVAMDKLVDVWQLHPKERERYFQAPPLATVRQFARFLRPRDPPQLVRAAFHAALYNPHAQRLTHPNAVRLYIQQLRDAQPRHHVKTILA